MCFLTFLPLWVRQLYVSLIDNNGSIRSIALATGKLCAFAQLDNKLLSARWSPCDSKLMQA